MFQSKSFSYFLILLLLPCFQLQVTGQEITDSTAGLADSSRFVLETNIGGAGSHTGPYTIAEITVSGARYLDKELLVLSSGLEVGQTVESRHDPKVSKAIRKLWDQGFFSDVSIQLSRIEGDKAYLNLHVQERPRLSGVIFKGVNKT